MTCFKNCTRWSLVMVSIVVNLKKGMITFENKFLNVGCLFLVFLHYYLTLLHTVNMVKWIHALLKPTGWRPPLFLWEAFVFYLIQFVGWLIEYHHDKSADTLLWVNEGICNSGWKYCSAHLKMGKKMSYLGAKKIHNFKVTLKQTFRDQLNIFL